MSDRMDRERLEKLARAVSELNRRDLRREHAGPGGLLKFIKYFWHVLEPQTKFVDGWVMAAMCQHLEAVTEGRIKRIAINVPPGSSKSLVVNCFWPAWEWGPKELGHMRYVSFSYGAWLTERDNARFRDLVQSKKWQDLYGRDGFRITEAGKIKVANSKTGWKFASSVGGVGTGERGNRILCFPAGTMVNTDAGPIEISHLVRSRMTVTVPSLSPTGSVESRPIIGWFTNPPSRIVRVNLRDGGSFRCTPNHLILTDRGYVRADHLRFGSRLASIKPRQSRDNVPTRHSSPYVVDLARRDAVSSSNYRSALVRKVDSSKLLVRNGERESSTNPFSADPAGRVPPREPTLDAIDYGGGHAVSASDVRECAVGARNRSCYVWRDPGLRAFLFNAKSSVLSGVLDVLRPRSVAEVFEATIRPVSVLVANLVAWGARAHERFHYHLVRETVYGRPCYAKRHPWVSLIQDGRHNPPWDGKEAAVPDYCSGYTAHSTEAGDLVSGLGADHGAPFFVVVDDVCDDGHADVTYCIEVEANHNFSVSKSFVLARNCDDPHNVADGESDVVRKETVRWFRESMSNRLNDMQQDAIVIIMQRVHEEDVCGTIMEDGLDYEHLIIPMRYDPGRHCKTSIGWSDPRTIEGELAWPERFPENVVEDLERTLGPYAFAGQYMQSPEPRGGGIFKREWWNPVHVPPGTPLKLTFQYVLASLDTAYTTKEENDPSAMTVWGVFEDQKGQPKILLLNAWEKRLELHGVDVERHIGERNEDYVKRAQPDWGLVEWVIYTCRRFKVDRLMIESKAAGYSVAQEVRRLTSSHEWAVELKDPKGEGDKVARAYAVQHLFSEGMVCAPAEVEGENVYWRAFAEMVIGQASRFPKGHDDLVDTMTQALRHLRQIGLAVRREERQIMDAQDLKYPERSGPLYPS